MVEEADQRRRAAREGVNGSDWNVSVTNRYQLPRPRRSQARMPASRSARTRSGE